MQACGRAIYTSYHTLLTTSIARSDGELVPQERILEYLMLEAGACVGPIELRTWRASFLTA